MNWTKENTALAVTMWDDKKTAREISLVLGTTKNAVIGKLHRLDKLRSQADLLAERQARAPRPGKAKTGPMDGTIEAEPVPTANPVTASPAAAIIDPVPVEIAVDILNHAADETMAVETASPDEEPATAVTPEPGAAAAEPSPGEAIAPQPAPAASEPESEPVAEESRPKEAAPEEAAPEEIAAEEPAPGPELVPGPESAPEPAMPDIEVHRTGMADETDEAEETGEAQPEPVRARPQATTPQPTRNVDDVADARLPFLKAPLLGRCKFPLWPHTATLRIEEKMVCGKPVPEGKSWCDHHRTIVHEPQRAGRRAVSAPRAMK